MNNDLQFDALIRKMAAEHRAELPSPDVIWWRALILKKQAEKQRIERPVTMMRMVAATFFLVVLAGLWISEADSMRAAWGQLGMFPFVPMLLAGVVMGLVVLALMWWTKSEV